MAGALEELLSGGGNNKKGGGKAPVAGGGAIAELLSRDSGSKGGSEKKGGKKKSTFFGIDLPKVPLIHVDLPAIGFHANTPGPVGQIRDLVAGAGPGLFRLGGELVKELAPRNPLTYLKKGQQAKGLSGGSWADVQREMPIISSQLESLVRTARQVPDTAVAIRPGGPGFGKSDLGRQLKEEGYLSTGLAKLADVTALAGGAGLLGRAAGVGNLAEAGRLERLAALADDAVAADRLTEAGRFRSAVEGAGKVRRGAEKATAKAERVAKLGGKVSAAPFVPTEKALKLVGTGAGKLAKLERVAPLMERAEAAVERLQKSRAVGDSYHENVRAPFESDINKAFKTYKGVHQNLSKDEQAAVYLATKGRELGDPAVRELLDAINELPEEVRPDAVRRLFPSGDVSAEAFDLARRFEDGTLDDATRTRFQDAADALSELQSKREERYVSGRGTSRQLSDEALEARRQRAAGQSADADVAAAVERKTAATRGRLAKIRAELDELNTAPEPEPVPLSRAQERRAAALAERTRRAEATVKGETERGVRMMRGAGQEVERNAARQANREGQVIGRGRERMLERDQLDTGVEARRKQAELKAKREAKLAATADDAVTDQQQRVVAGESIPVARLDRTAAKAGRHIDAADEAAAEAAKLKGIPKQPTRGEVQQRIHLDAERAKIKSRAEQDTANRLLGKQVEEQRRVVSKAQQKLEASQSSERAAYDKFERENHARADRAQRRRFEQLQERETKAMAKLEREAEEARNSVAAAPPQDRPALIVAERAKQLALELAESHPEHAERFSALADNIADTKAKLDAKGIKTEYFFGGKELEQGSHVPPTPKLRAPKKLQSERTRTTGTLARNVKAQADKYAKESLDMLHNEFRGTVHKEFGTTAGKALDIPRHATGEEIAAALGEGELVAWDPKTGKLLDAKDIDRNTAVIDKHLYETMKKYTAGEKGGFLGGALKVYDKATGGWKHTVLALSPRWHVGNIVGNAALATLGAGLSPKQIVQNLGEARRLVKEFEAGGEIPAEHVAALDRLLGTGHQGDFEHTVPATKVGRGIAKSYEFNEYVDNVNRTMVYLAKHKGGASSEAAVQLALKAAGDFSKMTPFERNVVRRIIPFYAWQRHITRLAFSLPIEAPARVAWTLHLADQQNRLLPDTGADNEFNEGTVPFMGKRLNVRQFFPFSGSFWSDPTFRGAGYQVNPVLKTAVAAGTGFNLGKMKPVSGRGIHVDSKTGKDNPSGFGAPVGVMPLNAIAQFVGQQVPQVTTIRDLIAGDVPVRYDTGEPRKVGPGATKKNAKPTLTGRGRKETVARFFGVPIPEPEQKAVKKK